MRRIIVPDSHGMYADDKAVVAACNIIAKVKPREIVFLGDHVDCSGLFSRFEPHYQRDTQYSIKEDFATARDFLYETRKRAPKADIHYLEGNHEQHIERWAVNNAKDDAETYLDALGAPARLDLEKLRIRYYPRQRTNPGTHTPGFVRLDKCLFTHGSSTAIHATYNLLRDYGTSIVHGHTHRAVHVIRRLPDGSTIHGACPGTLAQLQMTYQHTAVSQWSHGVGFQEIDSGGQLHHLNIPIVEGRYVLP